MYAVAVVLPTSTFIVIKMNRMILILIVCIFACLPNTNQGCITSYANILLFSNQVHSDDYGRYSDDSRNYPDDSRNYPSDESMSYQRREYDDYPSEDDYEPAAGATEDLVLEYTSTLSSSLMVSVCSGAIG